MDIEPQNVFQILKEHSANDFRGPTQCQRLLSILNYNLTEEQLSSSLIDLYLLHAFDQKNGIFSFILDVLSNKKFDGAIIKSLEITYTLVNNFSNKINPYILDINDKCMLILQSGASARVKVKALEVILISFEKVDICLENQDKYLNILEVIKNALKLDHAETIKQKEFMVLGLFAKKFRYLITDPQSLKTYFISHLESEMVKRCSQGNINGIFTGFGYFCESFPLSPDNVKDKVDIEKLYKYIKELSKPKTRIRIGNRAAIAFFGSHMNVFIKLAIKEYKQWHKKLFVDWLDMGLEEKKTGEVTLRAFLLAVSGIATRMNSSESKPILTHFINWLKILINKNNSSNTEKRIAIQGLKYFCSPLYAHYAKEEAREVFLIVMQNFEKIYILSTNTDNEEWEFLPDYVQCLASFMRYQHFTTSEIYCLQRAVINMIKTFHKLKPIHHYFVIEALITTIFYLQKTKHSHAFLENIVYQGVVWSCSHQHITNSEFSSDTEKIITVKNYFPLWLGLLKVTSNRSYDQYSIYFDDRKHILTSLVRELVKTLMILINKLNVTVKMKEDITETDIQVAYKVEQISDYAIFLNVTDFYQEIFSYIASIIFKDCICKMINHFVAKCLRYPLVSGFYKLLSFALKISNNLKLFHKENITLNQDVANCKETLSKFVSILLHKMKQFKDELLISCLHVLLESPVTVIEPMLPDCAGVFVTIFEVGRSYIALANMGLDTLEQWQRCVGDEEFGKFLEQVVPCLDSYLRSKSLGGLIQSSTVEKKRKTAQALKKRTVLVELEPELVKFQKRVLYFVGSQNSKICRAFVSPDNNFERRVISDNLHLKLALPYNDVTLEVYLEPFVMRVVELALYCSDRKTRVMACELLQAVVMVFLGRSKQMTRSSLPDLEDLLKSIAMPLLQLSCDIDQVVRQIFEPLFMQLIHWYTSPTQSENCHLAVIIEVLMEGVTYSTNSSLRDFSGKCINEFVKWTIKQTTEHLMANDPINIKILVKRMRFYSSHPDLTKKLGAALIFNNIYKEIREERALINIFSFELLHILITSLSLLENSNEEVDNTASQITTAVQNLKRILIEKPQVFRSKDLQRRVPSDIEDGDLKGLSKWLLTQTSSKSKYCRDISMELFVHIHPISGGKESLNDFVCKNFDDLMGMYEKHLSKYGGSLHGIGSSEGCSVILKWLQGLLCLVDGYIFVIKNSLCLVDFKENSLICKSILYFLQNLQVAPIEQALKLVYGNATMPYFTTENKEQYAHLKGSCCFAILKLANTVVSNEVMCEKSSLFWNNELWNLVLNSIFNPMSLGFDDKMPQPKHLEVVCLLLNTLPRKLPETTIQDLVQVLKLYVENNFDLNIDLKKNVSQKQRYILKGLLCIQGCQIDKAFCSKDYAVDLVNKLLSNFYQTIEGNVIFIGNLSETTVEQCCLVLEFALYDQNELKSLLSHLFKTLTVQSQDSEFDREVSFGLYILTKFGDIIVKFVVKNFEMFLESSENIEQIVQLTSFVLSYLEKNKNELKQSFADILEGIFRKWFLFELYFEETNVDVGLEFVRQIWRLFGQNSVKSKDVTAWVLGLVTREEILLTDQDTPSIYLGIFSVLAEIVADDNLLNLSNTLDKISNTLQSAVLWKQENNNVVDKILTTLPSIKSITIFKFLMDFYTKTNCDSNLTFLLKSFMVSNKEELHRIVLQTVYEMCVNKEKNFDEKKKLSVNVLPCVFKNSNFRAFEEFFAENINQVINKLENLKDFGEGMVSLALIELLFLRISIGSEDRATCLITEASGNPKLRQKLLKLTLDAFKTPVKGNIQHLRHFKCSAYKALASIITNSVKSPIFHEKLFVRQENNQDILWKSLIDTNVAYNFPLDFDSYPKKRKILVNIRDELRIQNVQNRSKSLRYIESQKLFNSSLSEDVTKFDFTNTILRTGSSTTSPHNEEENGDTENLWNNLIQSEVFLEATEINNHECMGTVCGVIENIFSSEVCQLPENEDDLVEFPKWMDGIRNLLLNENTHANVKIFWVKVIDNTIHIFRHFARYFVEPLLQFLIDKVAGNTINYFVTDVIVILTSWTGLIQPNEKEAKLASGLLKYLIESLNNERQDVLKYNLDLIKLLIENWREFIKVPYETLIAKLNYAVTDRKVEVGIHITSVFLVNGICPCENNNINSFWKKLLSILSSTVTTIYKPCSETLGLMLKYFKLNGLEEDSYSQQANKVILASSEVNKYASCLEGVAIHYPDIVDAFHLSKMFNRLSQTDQTLQTTFLKIIYKRVDYLNEVTDFKSEEWTKYIESQNAEVQLITLEIILKTFQYFKDENKFKNIIKSICKNLLNPNVYCRSRMYDILMAILENGDLEDEDVTELCKEVLIQGLVDPDLEIRDKIRTFWSANSFIPSPITTKFPYLMSKFYLAKAEEHFLGYVSYYLLDSIKSEDYEKELFEHPLEDCDFEEYRLQTNWRLQHPSVVPMFAETLRTYTEGLDDLSSSEFGALRATQNNFTFAPTQQTVREKYISQKTSLESSLFGLNTVDESNSNNRGSFLNPNELRLSEKYKLPKRRFLRDKSKTSAYHANVAVTQKIERVEKRFEAVNEREKRVTIYRSYRKGDFPDVQISLGSVIKPLQMLVLHDSELSKTLFSELYRTLTDKVKNNPEFTETISSSIKRIFTNSIHFNANLFSTLLDILLKSKHTMRIDPNLISSVCQQSGLVSVGTLLLEEYLISIDDLDELPCTSKKGSGAVDSTETIHWIKLAELYKELHEWDLVRTIFLEKTNCKEEVHKAIELESEKRWRDAQEKYQKLLKIDVSEGRKDFYYESYFKCLAHLGEWEKFPEAIDTVVPQQTGIWDALWDNDWYQQKLLPWYISSQVKASLFSSVVPQDFLVNINKSLTQSDQADYLKSNFSEELSILWLTQKDTAQASQYLKSSLDNFLSDWQVLNPMFGSLRYNKVLSLRNIVEVKRFLNIEGRLSEDCGEGLRELESYWKTTQKEFLPSIILSEAKLLYRRLFIKLLLEKVSKMNQFEAVKELKTTRILLDIAFMNTAIEEENYYMTRKYFREYANMKHNSLTMIYGNLAYLYTHLRIGVHEKLEKLLEALGKFKYIAENSKDDTQLLSATNKFFDLSKKVTELLSDEPDLFSKSEANLCEVYGTDILSPIDVAFEKLKSMTLIKLNNIDESFENDSKTEEITRALVKLAYFVKDKDTQDEDFVLYVLRAMKLGSKEARQLFPCILLKDSLSTDLKDIFLQESKNIPTWMFLGWIPQLLASVDSDKVSAISELVLRIAKTYPQSIMYSYRLSKENYSSTDSLASEETKILTEKLDELLLGDPVVDKFLTGLSKVSVPLAMLHYYIKMMFSSQDTENIVRIRDNMMKDLFRDTSDSRESSNMQGNMYKTIKDFKNEFEKINATIGVDKIKLMLKSIEVKRTAILNPKSNRNKTTKFSKLLKDYCPWLANFSAGRMNLELEIPGQYTGEKVPLVQHHVRISGFRESVSVMSSLRKPVKVTMLGMDSKEYPFLIKFGEDIRQDQRIQQLFILMNSIFASDNKNHHILTYQVVPLTSSLGIIQWVENTTSLDDFFKKSVEGQKRTSVFGETETKYRNFLEKASIDLDSYGLSASRKDRNRVIPFFQSLVNGIPWDLLRKSIWTMSLTTESFIAFRDNFIKSYAALCACHWVLGIGDRHLQNSKVCVKNGKVLGIDFGHAFGTATQILPVPELVPIRLTPHIVGLMEPLKEKGDFRDVMVACMRSLRENSGSLLATMNVFIQEPSVDWLENSKKFLSDPEKHEWYPLQKIDQAKRKLQGASSMDILIEDLKSSSLNASKPQYARAYVAVVRGNPQYDLRARLSHKEFLTVEEQVDSLIDHATDYNLLGRMYVGWSPYV